MEKLDNKIISWFIYIQFYRCDLVSCVFRAAATKRVLLPVEMMNDDHTGQVYYDGNVVHQDQQTYKSMLLCVRIII